MWEYTCYPRSRLHKYLSCNTYKPVFYNLKKKIKINYVIPCGVTDIRVRVYLRTCPDTKRTLITFWRLFHTDRIITVPRVVYYHESFYDIIQHGMKHYIYLLHFFVLVVMKKTYHSLYIGKVRTQVRVTVYKKIHHYGVVMCKHTCKVHIEVRGTSHKKTSVPRITYMGYTTTM